LPAAELVLVRVLQGQFFLCNVFCNADKIWIRGFVWFAFLATFRYLSLLEIDARFIEKQVFCMGLADLADLVSLVNLVNLVNCQAKNLLFNKPHVPKPDSNLPIPPLSSKTATFSLQAPELDTRPFFGLILPHAQA
jgi:hypothetical protein